MGVAAAVSSGQYFSLSCLDIDLPGTSFDFVVPSMQLLNFGLTILSDELTAGHSNIYTRYIMYIFLSLIHI